MSLNKYFFLLSGAIVLSSCAPKKEKSYVPIGKFDGTVKGYIIEDMPVLSGEEMSQLKDGHVADELQLHWHHQDLELTNLYGVSSQRAYKEFSMTQQREVVVAVLDSGVDRTHEDLKDVMWVNTGEIAGNGIDDDNNGYIDDIYGWNFLGGKDGRHIYEESLEVTRIYKRFLDKLEAGELLTDSEAKLYEQVKVEVESNLKKYTNRYNSTKKDIKKVEDYLGILKVKLGIQKIESRADIKAIESEDPLIIKIRVELLLLWDKYWRGFAGMKRSLDNAKYYIRVGYNTDYDARSEIVGDDPSNFTDMGYGNNDVIGPDAGHGTHVAGTIAASRNNSFGMNGVAANVKIMALRVIPNGDERDKDVALAVIYAVDNGADIINMSFGKTHSPYKDQVDKAFEYAAKNGVLIIHASGNDSRNIDNGDKNYPNNYLVDGSGVLTKNRISNWLEIGATNQDYGINLVAEYSNYGLDALSMFAPGSKIYSTIPGNRYAAYSGTSMAAPVASGVAAMLLSEYPAMTGSEAFEILKFTAAYEGDLLIRQPSIERSNPDFRTPVPFKTLSQSGGIINAYNAVKLANELSQGQAHH